MQLFNIRGAGVNALVGGKHCCNCFAIDRSGLSGRSGRLPVPFCVGLGMGFAFSIGLDAANYFSIYAR